MHDSGYPSEYLQGVTMEKLQAACDLSVKELLKTYSPQMDFFTVKELKACMQSVQNICTEIGMIEACGRGIEKAPVKDYPVLWGMLDSLAPEILQVVKQNILSY